MIAAAEVAEKGRESESWAGKGVGTRKESGGKTFINRVTPQQRSMSAWLGMKSHVRLVLFSLYHSLYLYFSLYLSLYFSI